MKIIKNLMFISLSIFYSTALFAQNPVQSLIPSGWVMLNSATGDLNQDKVPDLAIIIEKKKDPKNNIPSPRHLLVYLNQNHQYRLLEKNTQLASKEDVSSTCRTDPLSDAEGLSINRGILKLNLSYFMSCGGWEWPKHTYTFRLENKKMKLIGFDYFSFHRASGEESQSSYNFSTHKVKRTTGGNAFEGGKPKSTWESFKPKQVFYLSEINFDDFYSQFNY